ncbi:MAG: hypothetical protein QOK36_3911, partial [Gaiellales bacterium]|nr:hypothetical protein [Gaiellales bacterium]
SRLKFGRAHVDGLNVDSTPANAPDSGRNDAVALEPNALVDALLAQTGVGVTIVDRDLRVVRANRAFGVFGDRTPADVVGRSIADVLPLLASQIVPAMLAVLETGVPAIAHELVAPDANDPAQSKYFRTFRCPVVASDGSIVGVASTVIDITDLRNALAERDAAVARQREQAELNEYQATHDALTGLANRRKLYSDAAHALSEPGARSFALALFDLDGFKAYNDAFGHPAGDALLARLGHQIDDAIGGHGIAYRMGGDEFCVLTWAADPEQALEDARVALCCEGDGFSVRCSRGAALVPSQATTLEQALQFADERLYADKRANQVRDTQHARDALVQLVAEQRQLSPNIINLADLAAATATRLGLSPDDITCTRIAAALHDIGKTALPDAILNKAGPLDSDERAFVQRHAVIGERILTATPTLARIAPIVRASHERPDGKGYPDGLTVDGIPIGARIIAVVDAFDAMISPRPYKAPMSVTEAVAELRRCAGTQFDATVVQAFAHVIEEPRLELRAA